MKSFVEKFLLLYLLKDLSLLNANKKDIYQEYYDCLGKRSNEIKENKHVNAIICYYGEECLLESNSCMNKKRPYNLSIEWLRPSKLPKILKGKNLKNTGILNKIDIKKTNISSHLDKNKLSSKINLNKTNLAGKIEFNKKNLSSLIDTNKTKAWSEKAFKKHFWIDPLSNNYKISDAVDSQEGFYDEIENNQALIKKYHVTIVKNLFRYPVYFDLKDYEHELGWTNNVEMIDDSIQGYIEWSDWSECKCAQKDLDRGYKTRLGECFIKEGNISKEITNLKQMLRYFSNKMPCLSSLITNFSEIVNNKEKLKYFIMYAECSINCTLRNSIILSKNLDLNNQFIYNHIELVEAYVEEQLVLKCDSDNELSNKNANAFWKFEKYLVDSKKSSYPNDRIIMDKSSRLIIKKTEMQDETNYTCFRKDMIEAFYIYLFTHSSFDFDYTDV
ncbi:unnamed protein product [Brachionus calyciflorus]|uniref:Ig-like domain-containing protein n=1 Tax=Brachionus calyciflorus TaxID=104777 RepID=A0A813NNA4_9BILA|nr:unnamed protein product [Brachionus calyciflorus]